MRLGLSSYTLPWAVGVPGHAPSHPLTAEDLIDQAADWGLRVLQLADNLALADDRIDQVAARARARGVELSLGVRGSDPGLLAKAGERAERLGARLLRLLLDRGEDRPGHDEAVRRLRLARRPGLLLAVENHDRLRAAELAAVIRAVDDPAVGICLDTVNNLGAAEGPAEVVRELAPLTLDLHLKDFRVRRHPSALGFVVEGTPAGDGQLDVPWLLRELRLAGRDPDAIIELWTPLAEDTAATIAREREWAGRSLANLRGLIAA